MQFRSMFLALSLCSAAVCAACATTDRDASAHSGAKATADDPAAMWAEYEKLAQPGENHRRLDPMVGRFKTTTRMWMDPSQPADESSGTVDNRWILGNRFVMSEYKGTAMGKPFEGVGLLGYDNMKQCYVSTWCDNMGTTITPVSTGKMDASGKVLTVNATMDDPMTGKPTKMREITTIKSQNEHTFEMFATGPDGKEFKTLEIVYTRI